MAPATDPAAFFDLGNALLAEGDAEPAIAAFQRCVAMAPNHAGVRYNLGNALLQSGRPLEAVEAFLSCLQLAPGFGAAYVNLANGLRRLTLLQPARAMAELGVRHLPGVPEATLCLANVLHDEADYAGAASLYRQVLVAAPNHAGALSSLGNTLRAMGDLDAALAEHQRAIAIAPAEAEFHFNFAFALLASGDFARGWDEYEWRWQRPLAPRRGFAEAWRGEALAGRTILLHAEQGLGDTLQFVRYVPMVAALGARVPLEVQPSLLRLLGDVPGVAQVLAHGDALPPFDAHCPLLSLPLAFATRLETIPAGTPYLRADPDSVAAWRARLPSCGLRVGLVWAGAPHTDNAGAHLIDQRRSLCLHQFSALADIAGVQLISLQKNRRPPLPADPALIDPMPEVEDLADTAALVAGLDLVISADTSVAHLAGALGRKVWLLSRFDGCWRWLRDRDDSPWYPAMRIYRQERPHDWSGALERLRVDLIALVRQTPTQDA